MCASFGGFNSTGEHVLHSFLSVKHSQLQTTHRCYANQDVYIWQWFCVFLNQSKSPHTVDVVLATYSTKGERYVHKPVLNYKICEIEFISK